MTDTLKNTETGLLTSIAKTTGSLTLILTGIKILGFIEKQVLAYYFGTSYQVDAYFLSFSLLIVFWDFARGLMAPSYLPTLIAYRSKVGEEKSWEFTSTTLNLMGLIFLVMIGIGLLFSNQLVSLAAPGFVSQAALTQAEYADLVARFPDVEQLSETSAVQHDRNTVYIDMQQISGEQRQALGTDAFETLAQYATKRFTLAVGLTRLMLTGWAFFAIGILTGLTLNSYKRFLLAVADDVVFKVAGFLGLVLLVRYVGIYGLAWGIALGSWVAPVLHLVGLRKHLPLYTPTINLQLEPLHKMFRLMGPLVIGTICIESRRVIDNVFASQLRIGSVSALAFGYKLIEFAYVAIAEPLGVVVLPYFSDLARENDRAKLSDTVMTTLRTVVLVFTPIGASLFILRYPVVRLLFERGEFDALSTQFTVTALSYYAVGIVSFAVEPILLRSYFSLSDTTTPAIMEVVTIALHIAVITIFLGPLSHGSIALAFTLSKTVKVLVLYTLLKRKIGDIQGSRNLRFLGKLGIATVVMMLAMAGYQRWFGSLIDQSAFLLQALLIGTSGIVGVLTFLITGIALNVREIHLILHTVAEYIRYRKTSRHNV